PFVASYRLSHVPQVQSDPYVHLCFRPEPRSQPWYPGIDDDLKRRITASLTTTLLDASGKERGSLVMPLATATWGESQGLVGAYDFDRGRFRFEPCQSYVLKVSYSPGSVPPATKEAYVQLHACAYY